MSRYTVNTSSQQQKMLEEIKAVKFDNIKEDLVVRTLKNLVDNIYEVIDSSCSNKEFFQILMDTLYKGYKHILDTNPNAIEELDDVFVPSDAVAASSPSAVNLTTAVVDVTVTGESLSLVYVHV